MEKKSLEKNLKGCYDPLGDNFYFIYLFLCLSVTGVIC